LFLGNPWQWFFKGKNSLGIVPAFFLKRICFPGLQILLFCFKNKLHTDYKSARAGHSRAGFFTAKTQRREEVLAEQGYVAPRTCLKRQAGTRRRKEDLADKDFSQSPQSIAQSYAETSVSVALHQYTWEKCSFKKAGRQSYKPVKQPTVLRVGPAESGAPWGGRECRIN